MAELFNKDQNTINDHINNIFKEGELDERTLEKAVKIIGIANRIDEKLENSDAKGILKVIGEYSKALDLLDDYDHKTLKKIEGNIMETKELQQHYLYTF